MKPCVIKQPAGIGDIFFCQKFARYMAHHGYQIIWPVKPEIAWIDSFVIGVITTTILSSLITGLALLRLFRRVKM